MTLNGSLKVEFFLDLRYNYLNWAPIAGRLIVYCDNTTEIIFYNYVERKPLLMAQENEGGH